MYQVFKQLILPPAAPIVLGFFGVILAVRWRRGGLAVVGAALLLGYVLSTQAVGTMLLASLEEGVRPLGVIPDGEQAPQAIVVLSAELQMSAPEYGGQTVGPLTLQRVRYAARLQRASGLPVLVSGGRMIASHRTLAEAMAEALEQDFRVPVRWTEPGSGDTWENAANSAAVLRPEGVRRVLLVTHAWHMPRAVEAFRHAGLEVVQAPTGFTAEGPFRVYSLVPSAAGLQKSYWALHELVGRLYYRIAR